MEIDKEKRHEELGKKMEALIKKGSLTQEEWEELEKIGEE